MADEIEVHAKTEVAIRAAAAFCTGYFRTLYELSCRLGSRFTEFEKLRILPPSTYLAVSAFGASIGFRLFWAGSAPHVLAASITEAVEEISISRMLAHSIPVLGIALAWGHLASALAKRWTVSDSASRLADLPLYLAGTQFGLFACLSVVVGFLGAFGISTDSLAFIGLPTVFFAIPMITSMAASASLLRTSQRGGLLAILLLVGVSLTPVFAYAAVRLPSSLSAQASRDAWLASSRHKLPSRITAISGGATAPLSYTLWFYNDTSTRFVLQPRAKASLQSFEHLSLIPDPVISVSGWSAEDAPLLMVEPGDIAWLVVEAPETRSALHPNPIKYQLSTHLEGDWVLANGQEGNSTLDLQSSCVKVSGMGDFALCE